MIDVKEILGVVEVDSPLFIKKKVPDKGAAAMRLAVTERMFEQWHADINRTDTREMPEELVAVYDEAAKALCKVLMQEKEILNMEV